MSIVITERLRKLAAIQAGPLRTRQPIGIIGPGDGGPRECDVARDIAYHLAKAGYAIVCGGKGGVMQAASRGASEAGGIAIGILPEEDCSKGNHYLSVALPTGIGEMRNALIARSSLCLVAIGGGMGTISEMALGLKWGKKVFALYEDVQLAGADIASSPDDLLDRLSAWLEVASESPQASL